MLSSSPSETGSGSGIYSQMWSVSLYYIPSAQAQSLAVEVPGAQHSSQPLIQVDEQALQPVAH